MEQTSELVKFDFRHKEDVLRAFQISSEKSLNQSLPMANVTGIQRGANGAVRLAELELRYQMFKAKAKDGFVPNVGLLESTVAAS